MQMPQTKSAKKALRASRRKAAVNMLVRQKMKKAVKLARQKPTPENLKTAASLLSQAAKKKIIHRKKASRLTSRLAKLSGKVSPAKPVSKAAKTTKKKKSRK